MKKPTVQWDIGGVVAVIVGILFCFRIPYVITEVRKLSYFTNMMGLVWFSLYMLAAALITVGVVRIWKKRKK